LQNNTFKALIATTV